MKKHWLEKIQKAQGMVEFALVLPILLLVILGIIGFGHLFFSYSSVVAASREAARFGAAVGVTASGIPRYQDCNAIIAAAVRAGAFAGVNTTNVVVSYDHGPATPIDVFGTCPAGGTGPDVSLGDRISVQITVNYRSIVPIVAIPNFPLTALTRRTIVRSLQVGAAPTAESICASTHITMNVTVGSTTESLTTHTTHSVVGQSVSYSATVVPDDAANPSPTTSTALSIQDTTTNTPLFNQAFNAPTGSLSNAYWHAGSYTTQGYYTGDILSDPCYGLSALNNNANPHVVDPANTVLTFTNINPPYPPIQDVGTTVTFTVGLQAVPPGARVNNSWLGVTVIVKNTNDNSNCTVTLNAAGTGSCALPINVLGTNTITATYAGDADYNGSSATTTYVTQIHPTPTIVPTPTLTPVPNTCPTISNLVYGQNPSFTINNPSNGTQNLNITTFHLEWPKTDPAQLQQLIIGSQTLFTSTSTTGFPPVYDLTNAGGILSNANTIAKGTSMGVSMNFSRDLSSISGTYYLKIVFSNNCIREITHTQ